MEQYQKKVGATEQLELIKRRNRELPDAERVLALQRSYQKAKQEKGYKFYVLYDKMFLPYMLRAAWEQVKANGSSTGSFILLSAACSYSFSRLTEN